MNSAAGILLGHALPEPGSSGGQAVGSVGSRRFDAELLALLPALVPQLPWGVAVPDAPVPVPAEGAAAAASAAGVAIAGAGPLASPGVVAPASLPRGGAVVVEGGALALAPPVAGQVEPGFAPARPAAADIPTEPAMGLEAPAESAVGLEAAAEAVAGLGAPVERAVSLKALSAPAAGLGVPLAPAAGLAARVAPAVGLAARVAPPAGLEAPGAPAASATAGVAEGEATALIDPVAAPASALASPAREAGAGAVLAGPVDVSVPARAALAVAAAAEPVGHGEPAAAAVEGVVAEARGARWGDPAVGRREGARVGPGGTWEAPLVRGKAIAGERPQPWGRQAEGAVGGQGRAGRELPTADRPSARRVRGGALPRRAVAAPQRGAGVPLAAAPPPTAGRAEAAEPVPVGDAREVGLTARALERELPGMVVREARLAQRSGESELRVRVRPPELGEIRVTFRARDGELTGTVLAEREAVRGWLAAEAPAWREELAASGVRVSRIDVGLMAQDGAGADGDAQPWDGGAPPSGSEAVPRGSAPARGADAEAAGEETVGVNTAAAVGSIDYLA